MISRNKLIKELFELNKDLDNKTLMLQVKFALNSCDPIFYPAVKIRPTKVTLPKLNIEFPDGVLERKVFKYEKER